MTANDKGFRIHVAMPLVLCKMSRFKILITFKALNISKQVERHSFLFKAFGLKELINSEMRSNVLAKEKKEPKLGILPRSARYIITKLIEFPGNSAEAI